MCESVSLSMSSWINIFLLNLINDCFTIVAIALAWSLLLELEVSTSFTISFHNSIFLFTILFLYDFCLLSYVELEYLEGEKLRLGLKCLCDEDELLWDKFV